MARTRPIACARRALFPVLIALFLWPSPPAHAEPVACDALHVREGATGDLGRFFGLLLRTCQAARVEAAGAEDVGIRQASRALLDRFQTYLAAISIPAAGPATNATARYLIADAVGLQDAMRDWVLAHRQTEASVAGADLADRS